MSFPPHPPLPVAPTMTQGYTFTPMGMVPMLPVNMMPPTPVQTVVIPTPPIQAKFILPTPTATAAEISKKPEEEKPPVTTVFVGNISERAPDTMIRTMLLKCGNVLSWKRVQGASGKLQAFGFCEYERPESTLRCIRLLNDYQIADKNLVVKVDAKTKALLDDYLRGKKEHKDLTENSTEKTEESVSETGDAKEKNEAEDCDSDGQIDEAINMEDTVIKESLVKIIKEHDTYLSKEPVVETLKTMPKLAAEKKAEEVKPALGTLDMEEGRKDQISKEIRIFRDMHKEDRDPPPRTERDLLVTEERRLREYQRLRERELYKARLKTLERAQEQSRSRSKSPTDSKTSVERRRSRSREVSRERDRREREREIEIEEEAHERRKLEKKLREKENAYRERLKAWESRESKKHRDYRKERERETIKKDDEEKEARRLKEFLEDYDDERDDIKYYRSNALSRRMKEREKEIELDDRDRAREKEELEEIKKRLQEEGHPDIEAEIFKLERQRNEHLRPIKIEESHPEAHSEKSKTRPTKSTPERESKPKMPFSTSPKYHPSSPPPPSLSSVKPSDSATTFTNQFNSAPDLFPCDSPTLPVIDRIADVKAAPATSPSPLKSTVSDIKQETTESNSPEGLSNQKRKKLTVGDVFNQEDDDDDLPKKRKLIPLDYGDVSDKPGKRAKTIEEKRAHIKTLIEGIPTAKEELFAYPLDWTIVDANLMDKRIKPWVNKKIIEYIGDEEPTLTNFICQKVVSKTSPQKILDDVEVVLDDEAEVFVVKMWRLLIYETEAKKAGLVK